MNTTLGSASGHHLSPGQSKLASPITLSASGQVIGQRKLSKITMIRLNSTNSTVSAVRQGFQGGRPSGSLQSQAAVGNARLDPVLYPQYSSCPLALPPAHSNVLQQPTANAVSQRSFHHCLQPLLYLHLMRLLSFFHFHTLCSPVGH